MTKRIVVLSTLAIALLAGSSAAAPPTLEELTKLWDESVIDDSAKDVMRRFIKHWIGELVGAQETAKVAEARKKLVDGNPPHSSRSYSYEYARILSEEIDPALRLGADPLRAMKQINAAMVAEKMPHITIQPTLDKMAVHANPAVRYWAVRGYRNVGHLLLVQASYARKMLATLEKMGLSETSGPVVAGVLHAASGYEGVTPRQATNLRLVLLKVWLARLGGVYEGEEEMVEAYRKAVGHLRVAGKEEQQLALQLVIDAMEAASLAGLKKKHQEGAVGAALAELLSRLEVRLAGILGLAPRPIAGILRSDDTTENKFVRIRLQVNKYKDELKKSRAMEPRFKPPAGPNTKPAPATRPAKAVTTTQAAGK